MPQGVSFVLRKYPAAEGAKFEENEKPKILESMLALKLFFCYNKVVQHSVQL